MSKNTYFTGQPVYGQGINLLDRADNHQKKRIRLQMDGVFVKKAYYLFLKSIRAFLGKHTTFWKRGRKSTL